MLFRSSGSNTFDGATAGLGNTAGRGAAVRHQCRVTQQAIDGGTQCRPMGDLLGAVGSEESGGDLGKVEHMRTEHERAAQPRRFERVLAAMRDERAADEHADDERELGAEPVIVSLSFGASRRFRFRHRESREIVEIALESGSALVMGGLTQHCWMHDLPKTTKVDEPRVNLTFRHIA